MSVTDIAYDRTARLMGTPARTTNDIATRRFAMFLMNENLARAHIQDLQHEARSASQASRIVRARRLQRRADEIALRARRANARIV